MIKIENNEKIYSKKLRVTVNLASVKPNADAAALLIRNNKPAPPLVSCKGPNTMAQILLLSEPVIRTIVFGATSSINI